MSSRGEFRRLEDRQEQNVQVSKITCEAVRVELLNLGRSGVNDSSIYQSEGSD
jgi:hypothetical protein